MIRSHDFFYTPFFESGYELTSGLSTQAQTRSARWLAYQHTKYIPLCFLFPALATDAFVDVESIQVDLTFNGQANILFQTSANTATNYFQLLDMEITSIDVINSVGQDLKDAKMPEQQTKLSYIAYETTSRAWGPSMTVSGVDNLLYATLFFSAPDLGTGAINPYQYASNALQTFKMKYNNSMVPIQPVILNPTGSGTALTTDTEVYSLYKRAVGKSITQEFIPAMKFTDMQNCMYFYTAPFGVSDLYRLTPKLNLFIYSDASTVSNQTVNTYMCVCKWKNSVISTNGNVIDMSSLIANTPTMVI